MMRKSANDTPEKSNYLPSCQWVKKRMDSEHLNWWLTRGEIQQAAERLINFEKIRQKSPSKEIGNYNTET